MNNIKEATIRTWWGSLPIGRKRHLSFTHYDKYFTTLTDAEITELYLKEHEVKEESGTKWDTLAEWTRRRVFENGPSPVAHPLESISEDVLKIDRISVKMSPEFEAMLTQINSAHTDMYLEEFRVGMDRYLRDLGAASIEVENAIQYVGNELKQMFNITRK